MSIDDLTVGEVKQLLALVGGGKKPTPWPIGKAVFIRTITHHYTGRLIDVTEDAFILEDAAWIACSKRWADSLATGELDEVEPYPDGQVFVGLGAMLDVCEWGHDLPRKQQ